MVASPVLTDWLGLKAAPCADTTIFVERRRECGLTQSKKVRKSRMNCLFGGSKCPYPYPGSSSSPVRGAICAVFVRHESSTEAPMVPKQANDVEK